MLVASRLSSVQSMRHVLHPNCMPTIWPLHSGIKSHETCQNLATTLSFWMGPVERKWTSRCWNWLFTSTSNSNVRRLLLQLCFQLWSLVVLWRSYHQGLVGRRICFASLHSPMVAASPSTSPGQDWYGFLWEARDIQKSHFISPNPWRASWTQAREPLGLKQFVNQPTSWSLMVVALEACIARR